MYSDLFSNTGLTTICLMLLGQKMVTVAIQEYYTTIAFSILLGLCFSAIMMGLIPYIILSERKERRVKYGINMIPFAIRNDLNQNRRE